MSEVLGFALTFGMIAGMIVVLYVGGMAELRTLRDAAVIDNAERALVAFDENVEELLRDGATARTTIVQLRSARLGYGDPVVFNLTLVGESTSYRATVRPLLYRSLATDARIAYVNGMVVRASAGGSVVVSEPAMALDRRVVIPLIDTRTAGGGGVAGTASALVRSDLAGKTLFVRRVEGSFTLRLNVTTPRTGAWREYLEEATGEPCSVHGETVSCTFAAETVTVPLVRVDVSIE